MKVDHMRKRPEMDWFQIYPIYIDEGDTHEEGEPRDWLVAHLPNIDEGGTHEEVGLEIVCLIDWLHIYLI